MSKYIIKNCPAYYINTCSDSKVKEQYCSKCTDCVMKKIAGICKHELTRGYDPLAKIILSKLNIEEVE